MATPNALPAVRYMMRLKRSSMALNAMEAAFGGARSAHRKPL
jgi:hypothetical protein